MPDESAYVQVAPDSTGKKVANVAITEPTDVDPDTGAAQDDTTRYFQVVTLVDANGDPVALADLTRAVHDLTTVVSEIRYLLQLGLETT